MSVLRISLPVLLTLAVCMARAAVTATADKVTAIQKSGAVSALTDQPLVLVNFADRTASLASSPPAYAQLTFSVGADVANGAFVGDYTAAAILGVSFDTTVTAGVPLRGWAFLRATSGRIWCNTNLVVSADTPVKSILPFTLQAGWFRNVLPGTDMAAQWNVDLRSVAEIGVQFEPDGYGPQSARVEHFRLYGDGFMTEEAVLTRVANHFGVRVSKVEDLAASLRTKDSDRDGVADIEDVVAGREVQFVVEFADDAVSAAGIILRWPCEQGRRYTVRRATSITTPFEVIPAAANLLAQDNEYMTYVDVDAQGAGPFFYRITKHGRVESP